MGKGVPLCRELAHILFFSRMRRGGGYAKAQEDIRRRIAMSSGPRSSCWRPPAWKIPKSPLAWTCRGRSSVNGGNGSVKSGWSAWKVARDRAGRIVFPPEVVVEVKALACELPSETGLPFSRFSCGDIAREAVHRGLVASISGRTVWRWLDADALRPWRYRSWIFPRDPQFAEKAGRVLDLYQGIWEGEALGPEDYVISADEKTSIQARGRVAPGQGPAPGQTRRVEFEYERGGALAYVAAWDVRRAKLFGLCVPTTGIEPHHRLVDLVMGQEPYRSARRVFWVTDNGSSHRGAASKTRLTDWYGNAIQVHTPVHASWLNQIEIYFSVVQRKVLTPNEWPNLTVLEKKLLDFQAYYETMARPFEWKFTRADLDDLLTKLARRETHDDKSMVKIPA